METVIELRMCYRCGWISDTMHYTTGEGCRRCGGRHLTIPPTTKWNIFRYFLANPGRLKFWFLENVLKRNR